MRHVGPCGSARRSLQGSRLRARGCAHIRGCEARIVPPETGFDLSDRSAQSQREEDTEEGTNICAGGSDAG